MKNIYCLLLIVLSITAACTIKSQRQPETDIQVLMKTNQGNIILKLYDETPLHRDNFVKLVKEQFYDSLLFHRVIKNFMAQAGDSKSSDATINQELGENDLPYTVPFELSTKSYHKRGALGAARNGNISRASSSTQFYIVQGNIQTDSTLTIAKGRINGWMAENAILNQPQHSKWATIWNEVVRDKRTLPEDSLSLFKNRIDSLATDYKQNMTSYSFPKRHRETYRTIGGAPHLDQNYTVFGEVVSGMEVIDSIAKIPTNNKDRPLNDVRILSIAIIN